MNKKYILSNKQLFNDVIKKGKMVKNNVYVIYFLPHFEIKIGITIGTKLGKAHFRNYHKRIIRSICYQNINKIKPGYFVIIGRNGIKNTNYQQKEEALLKLIERLQNEQKN